MKKILFILLLSTLALYAQSSSGTYKEAMKAFNSGHYSEAARIFLTFLEDYSLEDELYASANFYIGESYFNLTQNNAAVPYFEFVVNNQRWTALREYSLYRLGVIYFEDGRYEKSRQNFRRLLNLYPNNEYAGSTLYWIGESYIREGKTDEARKFLEDAISNRQNNKFIDNTIFSLASVYEKTGDYENAVKYYDQLLSFHRNSPLAVQAQIRIGICYFKLKDYESSILELNNPVLSNLPQDLYSESLYMLANSYLRIESYKEAENAYREIITNYPGSKFEREANYGLAWSLFQQKAYNDAYRIFNLLSEGDDELAEKSFLWKAESKRYAMRESEAFELYKEFLQRYPNSTYAGEVQYQMGVINFDNKNKDISEKHLAAALKSGDPDVRAKAHTLQGEIELGRKNYKAARSNFEEVLKLNTSVPNADARATLGLGTALYYLKDYKLGAEYLSQLASERPQFESNKVNFYLAENLYAAGKYQEAIARYNAVSQDDAVMNSKVLYGKAYSNLNAGRYDQAAASFAEFIKKYPSDKNVLDARMRLADSYYGSKNYAAASGIYRDLFSSGKVPLNNPHLYFQYGQALYRGGKTDEAISKFLELRQKFPQSDYASRAYYLIGWIYFQRNEYAKAIDQYRSTLIYYPGGQIASVAYYSIGDAYYNLGKYDSAIVNYEKIIELFPKSPNVFDALSGIQYSYIALDQPERAVEKMDRYLATNPNAEFADQLSFKRGEIYYSNRSYEKAKTSYKSFINNYRNSKLVPDAYFWIGKSAQNLGQNEEAVYNYNRVIELYAKSNIAASAVIELTSIYNNMKNYDASVRLLDQIIGQTSNESPRKSEFLFLKANTLAQRGDVAAALDSYDEITMYYKNSLFADKAKFEQGMILMNLNRFNEAENSFRDLAERRTDDLGAKSQYYYGEALYQQKKLTDAITAFVRVRTIFSGYEEWLTRSYLRLGDSYIELEDKTRAAEMYRAVLSRNKGDQFGDEAQKKLRAIK
jgi:TolA-binding protein